jgi:membrane-bound metal-dependent hydrolase YbcI (DUF457 family)
MTLYEHVMLGIDGALAIGLQRRYGWPIVALAGCAAALPDWDALGMLVSFQCYADVHRVWGHNLLVAGVLAVVVSALCYRFNFFTKVHRGLAVRWSALAVVDPPDLIAEGDGELSGQAILSSECQWGGRPNSIAFASEEGWLEGDDSDCFRGDLKSVAASAGPNRLARAPLRHAREADAAAGPLGVWLLVGVLATYSHLLMDMLFSRCQTYPVWKVPLLWPFVREGWAWPLVAWGDTGVTLIFIGGMFAMVRWRQAAQKIAIGTLLLVAAYIAVRGIRG